MTNRLADEQDFPLLRELTYLNTASVGLVPDSVQDDARRFDRDVSSRGTTWFDELEELRVLDRARLAAASLLGASEDEIAVVSSATELLCQLAWHVRPAAGENVVSVDCEFPSVVYPWLRIAGETAAEVRLLAVREDPAALSVDALAKLVDSNTRAICVSHVQYWNGAVLDLGGLSRLAQDAGVLLVIDATQSAGAVPIDVSLTPVDALVTGGYKFLGGPFGAAIGYLSPELLDGFVPAFVGWRTADDAYSFDATELRIAPSARRLEFSTMNYTAALSLGAAIEYIDGIGIERISAHNRELGERLFDGLVGLGAEIISPPSSAARGSIVTARFPGRDGEEVAAQLNAKGVIVSPRVGTTRFAPHFFNNSADIDRALTILGDILGSTAVTSTGRYG
jgi:selenocysteine lyase/cysteine desulfurase